MRRFHASVSVPRLVAFSVAVALPAIASACGRGPISAPDEQASPTSAAAALPPAPAVARTRPAAPTPAWSSRTSDPIEVVPTEKFANGARTFAAVKDAMLAHYVDGSFTEDDLYRGAVQGMLEHVDPARRKWNKLVSPSELAWLKADLSGEFVGIGVTYDVDPATGYEVVHSLVPGAPAEKAGLKVGDTIVSVDGKVVKDKCSEDVASQIRGKAGETVNLVVLRGDALVTFAIVRGVVRHEEVVTRELPSGVGYVEIRGFSERTPARFRAALEAIQAHGDTSIILDLRENEGGSFEAAVACAELLIPQGKGIATLKKRTGEETFTSKHTALLPAARLVVVVGCGTASGAELMAASLQETRGARLVGKRTLGKWTLQQLDTLSNGYGTKFTIGIFATPSGKSYEVVGLPVDVEVEASPVSALPPTDDPEQALARDAQLHTAHALLRP